MWRALHLTAVSCYDSARDSMMLLHAQCVDTQELTAQRNGSWHLRYTRPYKPQAHLAIILRLHIRYSVRKDPHESRLTYILVPTHMSADSFRPCGCRNQAFPSRLGSLVRSSNIAQVSELLLLHPPLL